MANLKTHSLDNMVLSRIEQHDGAGGVKVLYDRHAFTGSLKNSRGGAVFHDGDAKEAFGLDRKAKWPEHGMDPQRVQGVTMWVQEVGSTPLIRALCKCPVCYKTMAIGRFNQHAKSHKE